MNKVILMGRLTRDPEVRYTTGQQPTAIARYSLAVDRRYKQDGQQNTDFINIVAFGKGGEFAEKYLRKGMKVVVTGRIQTGSYTNQQGATVYTTDVVAEDQEFAESKNSQNQQSAPSSPQIPQPSADEFMSIPDGFEEELPFN